MNRDDVANYSVLERLKDGRTVAIRSVRPGDKESIASALRGVSPESFYSRTFSTKRELSDDELKRLTEVDFNIVVALVAVIHEKRQERMAGGGRFVRPNAGSGTAEVAFFVDDAFQGLGIGSLIFRHLVAIARATGIKTFEADVLPSNERMLQLFNKSGLTLSRTATRDAVHVIMDLGPADEERKGGKKEAA